MMMWRIILKSLRQHWLSTGLAILSIALGVGLLVSVVSLREQAHNNFTQVGLGVDAVLGPKGSPLQIVLNAIYNLEEMPGKIPWPYYQQVLKWKPPGGTEPIVVEGIPFCTGHSYAGFRVNAIDRRFLTDFEYLPGRKFSFNPADGGQGRAFGSGFEAVAGAAAARELGVKLGDTFNPTCGVNPGGLVHHNNIRFVGIMAPTGTPYDRAIYIPLTTFYQLEGHEEVAKMAVDEQFREISGAFLKIRRIAGGAIHPGIMDLKYEVNQAPTAQFVVPNEVLPKLFEIIGWVDKTLLAISILVIVLATLFLLVALVSALRERRRDIALMRALGATRTTIFGLVVSESVIIAVLGGIFGLFLGHAIVAVAANVVRVETGLRFSEMYLSQADWFLFPSIVVLGFLSGLIPAVQAYRTGVLKNLTPIS